MVRSWSAFWPFPQAQLRRKVSMKDGGSLPTPPTSALWEAPTGNRFYRLMVRTTVFSSIPFTLTDSTPSRLPALPGLKTAASARGQGPRKASIAPRETLHETL